LGLFLQIVAVPQDEMNSPGSGCYV
jgi:hypothetical protein